MTIPRAAPGGCCGFCAISQLALCEPVVGSAYELPGPSLTAARGVTKVGLCVRVCVCVCVLCDQRNPSALAWTVPDFSLCLASYRALFLGMMGPSALLAVRESFCCKPRQIPARLDPLHGHNSQGHHMMRRRCKGAALAPLRSGPDAQKPRQGFSIHFGKGRQAPPHLQSSSSDTAWVSPPCQSIVCAAEHWTGECWKTSIVLLLAFFFFPVREWRPAASP